MEAEPWHNMGPHTRHKYKAGEPAATESGPRVSFTSTNIPVATMRESMTIVPGSGGTQKLKKDVLRMACTCTESSSGQRALAPFSHTVTETSYGSLAVSYTLEAAGTVQVELKYDGHNVHGSPLELQCRAPNVHPTASTASQSPSRCCSGVPLPASVKPLREPGHESIGQQEADLNEGAVPVRQHTGSLPPEKPGVQAGSSAAAEHGVARRTSSGPCSPCGCAVPGAQPLNLPLPHGGWTHLNEACHDQQAGGGGGADADDPTSIASSGCPPAACTASQGQAALRFPEAPVAAQGGSPDTATPLGRHRAGLPCEPHQRTTQVRLPMPHTQDHSVSRTKHAMHKPPRPPQHRVTSPAHGAGVPAGPQHGAPGSDRDWVFCDRMHSTPGGLPGSAAASGTIEGCSAGKPEPGPRGNTGRLAGTVKKRFQDFMGMRHIHGFLRSGHATPLASGPMEVHVMQLQSSPSSGRAASQFKSHLSAALRRDGVPFKWHSPGPAAATAPPPFSIAVFLPPYVRMQAQDVQVAVTGSRAGTPDMLCLVMDQEETGQEGLVKANQITNPEELEQLPALLRRGHSRAEPLPMRPVVEFYVKGRRVLQKENRSCFQAICRNLRFLQAAAAASRHQPARAASFTGAGSASAHGLGGRADEASRSASLPNFAHA